MFNYIFIKIRFGTHDNIGSGPIHLPPDEMHTSASWLSFTAPDKWTEEELTDAMTGVAYAMNAFIPLFIQCDSSDVAVVPQVKATHNERPTFFVYDKYPSGIGLSEKVYELWEELIMKTMSMLQIVHVNQAVLPVLGHKNHCFKQKER